MKTTLYSFIVMMLLGVGAPASAGINVSISSRLIEVTDTLFDRIGVDFNLPEIEVHLPERAAAAVDNAFDHAEMAIDDVFGEGGVLDQVEFETPDVDQIVSDALGAANDVLENLDLPVVNVPPSAPLDIEGIVENALGEARDAVSDLDEIVPDVESIVEDALGDAQDVVDDALGEAQAVIDELDEVIPEVEEIVEGALNDAQQALDDALEGASGVVEEVLQDIEVELPPAAIEALESLPVTLPISFSTTVFSSGPLVTARALAAPEPSASVLTLLTIGLAARRGRRKA